MAPLGPLIDWALYGHVNELKDRVVKCAIWRCVDINSTPANKRLRQRTWHCLSLAVVTAAAAASSSSSAVVGSYFCYGYLSQELEHNARNALTPTTCDVIPLKIVPNCAISSKRLRLRIALKLSD